MQEKQHHYFFTAFGSPYLVHNVFKPMGSLPLLIFNYAMSPYADLHTLAWGASFILITFILLMNFLVKVISYKWKREILKIKKLKAFYGEYQILNAIDIFFKENKATAIMGAIGLW